MIENFNYLTKTGVRLELNLGIYSFFHDSDFKSGLVREYQRVAIGYGLRWIYAGKEITILNDNSKIIGYPSVDLNFVIGIHLDDENTYKRPCNAVVYYPNGDFFKCLCVPKLVSRHAMNRKKWWKNEESSTLHFERACWMMNSSGVMVTALEVREYHTGVLYEKRYIDTKTWEFGECLESGVEYK